MKKFLSFVSLVLLISCSATQLSTFEPYGTTNVFTEKNKKIAYQEEDSVFVSVSGISYVDSIFTIEAVVDNKSGHFVSYAPQTTYLFRYSNDSSLQENKVYYAADRDEMLKSLDDDMQRESDKLVGKTIFSIFLGAAFVAADIAAFDNDNLAQAMPAIAFTHDAAQIALDASRSNNYDKMDQIESRRQEVLDQTSPELTINPHHYMYVTLKFKVPFSPYYKIYLDVDSKVYQFTFQGTKFFNS